MIKTKIKGRNEIIKAINKLFVKYQRLLKNKTLSQHTKIKIKIYKKIIKAVITYAVEIICLTQKDEEKLRIQECKTLKTNQLPTENMIPYNPQRAQKWPGSGPNTQPTDA